MPLKPTSVSVHAADDIEATRKALSLAAISQLTPESLAVLAAAARKPGADAKIKQYRAFL